MQYLAFPKTRYLIGFLKKAGKKVTAVDAGRYTYALSRNRISREVISSPPMVP